MPVLETERQLPWTIEHISYIPRQLLYPKFQSAVIVKQLGDISGDENVLAPPSPFLSVFFEDEIIFKSHLPHYIDLLKKPMNSRFLGFFFLSETVLRRGPMGYKDPDCPVSGW